MYYKVNLCKVEKDKNGLLFLENCSKKIIVRKRYFGKIGKEILTNKVFNICTLDEWSNNKNLCYSEHNLSNYGVDYFIFKYEICDGNIVDADDVEEYIDNFEDSEYEFIDLLYQINKKSKKEQKKVKELIRSYKEDSD